MISISIKHGFRFLFSVQGVVVKQHRRSPEILESLLGLLKEILEFSLSPLQQSFESQSSTTNSFFALLSDI